LLIGPNVHLKGAGRGATIIRGSSAIFGKTVAGAFLGTTIGGAGVWNVTVSDLTIDHRTYARNSNGISFVPTGVDYTGTVPSNILIERVEVWGAGAGYHNYLIWNLKGQHVKIRDNWLNGGYSIPVSTPAPQEGIETYGGYDVLITGNTVQGVGGSCINAGSAGIPASTTVGVSISKNYLFGCTVGVNLGTSTENGGQHNYESKITENVIIYAAQAGITIPTAPGTTQRNLHISGNSIRVVGPGPHASGIRVSAGPASEVDGITISSNHVHTVTGPHGHGISIGAASNVRVLDNTLINTSGEGVIVYRANDVEVSRNRIERAGVYAVYVGPAALRSIVTENIVADWSAASPALLLEGIRYGAIHRNLFRRSDGAQPGAIAMYSSCGVEMSGNQALYAGPTANG
jgi:nitrous oxidase accessory protein NosD